ncbi:hypothetical protein P153DRAFT_300040 [Dothidotthia symphoricarpi CBS 119687]|uniref:Uncharacterized protein n=1 Tax=Dothidotthia symphoricarpi CBS 119687 TaxID=1392245 RepID=A0A6A6A216_9PLEO|nr:uncharacterized protein P153DRAFT_300040 [Dothidotthia symphoricarpi CBS 119687]KAF2125576.1 hypothetical protein P153DRAFT_300040 [Dothidotthia symphoricarpi CBS 119687]
MNTITTTALPAALPVSRPQYIASSANTTVTFLSTPGDDKSLIVSSTAGQAVTLQPLTPTSISFTTYTWNPDERQVYWAIGLAGETSPVRGAVSIRTTPLDDPPTSSVAVSAPTIATTTTQPSTIVSVPPSTTGTTTTSGTVVSQAPVTANKGSSGVAGGTVAGVAIGCLVAGALIAGVIFWFCCGKRRKTHERDSEASKRALMPREKGPTVIANSLGSKGHAASPLGSGLPQPLEDEVISGEITKISSSIKNHVKSYYHASPMSSGLVDTDDIQALGYDMPVSVGTLSTLLGNPATRETALQFCIAWVVVSGMQPHNDPLRSFLPRNAGGCYQEILTPNPEPRPHAASTARWRTATAALLPSTYVRSPFSPTDSRNASIQAAVDVLDNILVPYANSRADNGQRKRNLEEILKRSALFAFTLFSQPSSWEFDWKEQKGSARSGGFCIFPALVQASNEAGEPVRPPRPFSEAVIRRLDE